MANLALLTVTRHLGQAFVPLFLLTGCAFSLRSCASIEFLLILCSLGNVLILGFGIIRPSQMLDFWVGGMSL